MGAIGNGSAAASGPAGSKNRREYKLSVHGLDDERSFGSRPGDPAHGARHIGAVSGVGAGASEGPGQSSGGGPRTSPSPDCRPLSTSAPPGRRSRPTRKCPVGAGDADSTKPDQFHPEVRDRETARGDRELREWGVWAESNSRPGVYVPRWAMRLGGSPIGALVLAQLGYWFGVSKAGRSRASVRRRGLVYVAKSMRELAEEVRCSEKQVRRVVKSLEGQGLLVREVAQFRGSPTTFIRLCFDRIRAAADGEDVDADLV